MGKISKPICSPRKRIAGWGVGGNGADKSYQRSETKTEQCSPLQHCWKLYHHPYIRPLKLRIRNMVAESNIEASAEQALHNGFSPLHVENPFLPTMLQVSALWVQLIRALLTTWNMSTLCWKHEMHGLSLSRPLIHVQQAINLVATRFAKNGHKSLL